MPDPGVALGVAATLAALVAAGLIPALTPLLRRYALARPNARSSHAVPTPQGAGIAVIAGLIVGAGAVAAIAAPSTVREIAIVSAAALLLAVVGAIDDIRPLPAAPRLVAQALAVAAVALLAPPETVRLFPALPQGVEVGLVILAGVWFVNLTNFMDGLDLMTAAGLAPALGALAIFAALGGLDLGPGLLAAALFGGLIGFAPFNRHPARVFLGDVGSLPIGLVTGYALYRLAGDGALVAALILPAYHLADATLTLIRRARAGEKLWEAHRRHFYQMATAGGWRVPQVSGAVAALSLTLALLALTTPAVIAAPLTLLLVAATLRAFARGRRLR